jgi:hypothetical protein
MVNGALGGRGVEMERWRVCRRKRRRRGDFGILRSVVGIDIDIIVMRAECGVVGEKVKFKGEDKDDVQDNDTQIG